MANMNDKTAFQLGTDALSKIIYPRKHSQEVNEHIYDNRSFLETFRSMVERASVLSGANSRAAFSALLQEIKFSDPISVAEALEDENRLLTLAEGFLLSVESGEIVKGESIEKARMLLIARNNTCKEAK